MSQQTHNEKKLNSKTFQGKYAKSVEMGIIKAYSKLYPDNEITVSTDRQNNGEVICGFQVYLNNLSALDKDGDEIKVTAPIKFYSNLEAINFSDIPDDKFQEVYNDYSLENHKWLQEKFESLQIVYAFYGIKFTKIQVNSHGYNLEFYKENESQKNAVYLNTYFNRSPISKSVAQSAYNKIKKYMDKYVKRGY